VTSDLALLLWLRWRHGRGRAAYWGALAGADVNSGTFTERSYLAYLALLILGWFVLMMSAAANAAASIGSGIGPDALGALAAAAIAVPYVVLAVLGARALRSSPVKLTFPDIAYVGATAIDTRAIAVSSCLREVAPAAIGAGLVGYLVGAIAFGAGASASALMATALTAAGVVFVIFPFAWALGLTRVRTDHAPWPRVSWVAAPVAALGLFLLPASARWPGTVLGLAMQGKAPLAQAIPLLAAAGVALCLVAWAATRLDMTTVIDESALYAQLQIFRPLQLYDPIAYADIVRRKRIAARGPRAGLLRWSGMWALVARALLSHARQPRSLLWPVVWGALILPYLAWVAGHGQSLIAYFPAVFVFVVGPSRQLLHVFGQDADRPSLRRLLPFGNVQLLLADSAPVIVVILAASALVVAAIGGPVASRVLGAVLCGLLGLIAITCRGLERQRFPRMRAPIGYGITSLVSVVIVLAAGAIGSSPMACVAAAAALAVLLMLLEMATE
jgi:hypothetical protein